MVVCALWLGVVLLLGAQRPDDPRIRVAPKVQAAKLVKQIEPIYPGTAILGKVSGTVTLHLLIAGDGGVKQLNYTSGPPMLMYSAMNAVRECKYRRTMLDGEPIDVDTSVSLVYLFTGPGQGKVLAGIEQQPQETPTSNQGPQRIRVYGNPTILKMVKHVDPKYPEAVKKAAIREEVLLNIIIATDGNVRQATCVSGPQDLAQSAIDAVKQWKYQPPELDGKLVEIESIVSILFMNDLPL